MKIAFVGLGQAGGKIVDQFVEFDAQFDAGFVESAVAINTAVTDLDGLENIPESNQILIGQSRVNGHGVGADNDLAAEIAHANTEEMLESLDSVDVAAVDAFLLVAGLGGGTGSGVGPVLANALQRVYDEPVYGLGILPSTDEGGIYALNASRSLQTYVRELDNLLLFDNDTWHDSAESMAGGFDTMNEALVRRFGVLFSAGEYDESVPVAQGVVDTSEIINTLDNGGLSTVGYANSTLDANADGLLSRFSESEDTTIDSTSDANRIASLVRQAVLGQLTMPCSVEGVERALVIVSGPPEHLGRKGIERARSWVEEETGSLEVRGGDYPIADAGRIAAVVVLSGITKASRVDALIEQGLAAKERMEEQSARHETGVEELIGSDDIDSLL